MAQTAPYPPILRSDTERGLALGAWALAGPLLILFDTALKPWIGEGVLAGVALTYVWVLSGAILIIVLIVIGAIKRRWRYVLIGAGIIAYFLGGLYLGPVVTRSVSRLSEKAYVHTRSQSMGESSHLALSQLGGLPA